jgi:hypothetical protein
MNTLHQYLAPLRDATYTAFVLVLVVVVVVIPVELSALSRLSPPLPASPSSQLPSALPLLLPHHPSRQFSRRCHRLCLVTVIATSCLVIATACRVTVTATSYPVTVLATSCLITVLACLILSPSPLPVLSLSSSPLFTHVLPNPSPSRHFTTSLGLTRRWPTSFTMLMERNLSSLHARTLTCRCTGTT